MSINTITQSTQEILNNLTLKKEKEISSLQKRMEELLEYKNKLEDKEQRYAVQGLNITSLYEEFEYFVNTDDLSLEEAEELFAKNTAAFDNCYSFKSTQLALFFYNPKSELYTGIVKQIEYENGTISHSAF